MSNDWMVNLHFGIPPQEQEPKDMREMRQIIDRAGRDCMIINRSECTARHLGLSGEDKYTLLAYYALLEVHRLSKIHMRWLTLSPLSPIVINPKSP